mmetsp:Transcript_8690/g.16646  ORF Transcript_8690/g.16646 Transcript_8690/m.16646 type:complete len:297 (-) Transcript_8690:2215-3105(-)
MSVPVTPVSVAVPAMSVPVPPMSVPTHSSSVSTHAGALANLDGGHLLALPKDESILEPAKVPRVEELAMVIPQIVVSVRVDHLVGGHGFEAVAELLMREQAHVHRHQKGIHHTRNRDHYANGSVVLRLGPEVHSHDKVRHHRGSHHNQEQGELPVVRFADAVVNPRAVVVELGHAPLAVSAVLGAQRAGDAASDADQIQLTLLQALCVGERAVLLLLKRIFLQKLHSHVVTIAVGAGFDGSSNSSSALSESSSSGRVVTFSALSNIAGVGLMHPPPHDSTQTKGSTHPVLHSLAHL